MDSEYARAKRNAPADAADGFPQPGKKRKECPRTPSLFGILCALLLSVVVLFCVPITIPVFKMGMPTAQANSGNYIDEIPKIRPNALGGPSRGPQAWPRITLWPIVIGTAPATEKRTARAQSRVAIVRRAARGLSRESGGVMQFDISTASYGQTNQPKPLCYDRIALDALEDLSRRGETPRGRIPIFFAFDPECQYMGLNNSATGPIVRSWVKPSEIDLLTDTIIHELAHMLGVGHANGVVCTNRRNLATCDWNITREYAAEGDIMGSGDHLQLGPYALSTMGVDRRIVIPSGSIGRITLAPAGRGRPSQTLVVPLDGERSLFLQARAERWGPTVLLAQVGRDVSEPWEGPKDSLTPMGRRDNIAFTFFAGERLRYGKHFIIVFEKKTRSGGARLRFTWGAGSGA